MFFFIYVESSYYQPPRDSNFRTSFLLSQFVCVCVYVRLNISTDCYTFSIFHYISSEIQNMATSGDGDALHEDDGLSFSDFMLNIESHMKNLMIETTKAPTDFYEHYSAFKSAINWKENFIKCLVLTHIVFFILVVYTRKNIDLQTFFFFIICISVYFSEWINTWCSDNWQLFATQDYFDKKGAFAGIMFSAPLLCIAFFQLVSRF